MANSNDLLPLLNAQMANLKLQYAHALQQVIDRANEAVAKLHQRSYVTHHDGFNLGSSASEVQMIAGKIEDLQLLINHIG
jgi:hypothetical protein